MTREEVFSLIDEAINSDSITRERLDLLFDCLECPFEDVCENRRPLFCHRTLKKFWKRRKGFTAAEATYLPKIRELLESGKKVAAWGCDECPFDEECTEMITCGEAGICGDVLRKIYENGREGRKITIQ